MYINVFYDGMLVTYIIPNKDGKTVHVTTKHFSSARSGEFYDVVRKIVRLVRRNKRFKVEKQTWQCLIVSYDRNRS